MKYKAGVFLKVIYCIIKNMKIAGIIAEYNPLHKGHIYHINEACRITQSDYVIVCMSGNFTQRGESAIINKYMRTKCALWAGADVVVELPVSYATSSADDFALGAVSLLNHLGCVDTLCFGSECADLNQLTSIANTLSNESEIYRTQLKERLENGQSYPRAINDLLGINLLSNDILGVSYLKSLKLTNSTMQPVVIPRTGGDYQSQVTGDYSSMAIRQAMKSHLSGQNPDSIDSLKQEFLKNVPSDSIDILLNQISTKEIMDMDDFTMALYSRIKNINNASDLTKYADVSESIAFALQSVCDKYPKASDWSAHLQTKNYSGARIKRALLHILLNICDKDICNYKNAGVVGYARVLGFKKGSESVLSEIKKHSDIPLISKPADAKRVISAPFLNQFETDIDSSMLYEYTCANKNNRTPIHEMTRSPIVM